MHSIMVSNVQTPVCFSKASKNAVQKNQTNKKYLDRKSEIALITGLCCMAAGGAAFVALRTKSQNAVKKLMYSFENFLEQSKKVGIEKSQDMLKECVKENVIGSGQNSVVYNFSNPLLKNWIIKVITKHNDYADSFNQPIQKLQDDFDGENMGQAIATVGKRVQILKKLSGKPHSVQDWAERRTAQTPIKQEEAEKFLEDIKQIAKFPQKSFDEYAKKLKILDDKGYKADSFNPNNYLIDYSTKEINIVDAYKYDVDAHMNTKYDLLGPLVDYPNFEKFYNAMNESQKADYIQITKLLAHKCTRAAKKQGVNTSEDVFREFIGRIDGREKNGNMYTKSFDTMKNILEGAV